jgi:hypothetical protein
VRILARRADVLLENFPPGGIEKFGLSLARLRQENPRREFGLPAAPGRPRETGDGKRKT